MHTHTPVTVILGVSEQQGRAAMAFVCRRETWMDKCLDLICVVGLGALQELLVRGTDRTQMEEVTHGHYQWPGFDPSCCLFLMENGRIFQVEAKANAQTHFFLL